MILDNVSYIHKIQPGKKPVCRLKQAENNVFMYDTFSSVRKGFFEGGVDRGVGKEIHLCLPL